MILAFYTSQGHFPTKWCVLLGSPAVPLFCTVMKHAKDLGLGRAIIPIASVGLVYRHLPYKSTIHVGKYTVRPMDPSWDFLIHFFSFPF